MLNGISNFEWKRVEKLVDCQQLLLTGMWWHSKVAAICVKTVEKNTIEPL
jgi:hypothetical protein